MGISRLKTIVLLLSLLMVAGCSTGAIGSGGDGAGGNMGGMEPGGGDGGGAGPDAAPENECLGNGEAGGLCENSDDCIPPLVCLNGL